MSKLKTITLHAARSKSLPEGSSRHGYTFVAPLGEDGKIDAAVWKTRRAECFVHRFWADEPDRRGLLVHIPGGYGGATWVFEMGAARLDEEPGFRFADHAFVVGEYVSLREEDGEMMTFKVISVV